MVAGGGQRRGSLTDREPHRQGRIEPPSKRRVGPTPTVGVNSLSSRENATLSILEYVRTSIVGKVRGPASHPRHPEA